MAEFLETYSLFFLTAVIAIAVMFWQCSRINSILESWAKANNIEIMSRSLGLFRPGPFFFTLGHQVVHFLTVRDPHGLVRRCWVKLGGSLTGLSSDTVETRWEP